MFSAEFLMHGAAHASQHTPPRPAVNVDCGAHSVVSFAPDTYACAFGEANVVADETHAAAAASQLLTGLQPLSVVGDFNASGTGACASDDDDDCFYYFQK